MSEAHKEAIRQGQLRRHDRTRKDLPRLQEFKKRCTKCEVWKVVRMDGSGDFRIRRRRIVSGDTLYPSPECKECASRRSAEWRGRLREEGVLLEKQRAWSRRRDDDDRRRYQRDYGRMRRAMAGAKPRGPWHRYREPEPDWRVTCASFFPLWARALQLALAGVSPGLEEPGKLRAMGGSAGAVNDWLNLSESEYETVTRIFRGWVQGETYRDTVAFDLADKILIAAGLEHRRDELEVLLRSRRRETPGITGIGESPLDTDPSNPDEAYTDG